MWTKLAHNVIKFRLPLIIILALITIFMGYRAKNIEMDYDLAQMVPDTDVDFIALNKFKDLFGDDGNILAIGIKDSSLYEPQNFARLNYLARAINDVEGVTNVLSIANLQQIQKNTAEQRFEMRPMIDELPENQEELDSLLGKIVDEKFYSGQLINLETGATAIVISVDEKVLNSADRQRLMQDIIQVGDAFAAKTSIELHYAGLPFVRSVMMGKVRQEIIKLLVLSVLVTAFILLLFFRSWDAVLFPLLVIFSVVIWSMGTLDLLGYKVTILTGLIPTIIVVIGIPNSIYLLNKYHQEFDQHGNKIKAISTIIRKIGVVTLITNFTTAVGFLVLAVTDIKLLREFGIVVGINIFATFIVSIILIPAVFSYLPKPGRKQLKHLNFKMTDFMVVWLNKVVHGHRTKVYVTTGIIIVVSFVGLFKINSISYMIDDLPEDGKTKTDLRFFEQNFSGIMPLEVVINTGKKRGIVQLNTLRKVEEFEQFLDSIPAISQPVSIVSMIKSARQAYYNNNPAFYSLPSQRDYGFIMRYLKQEEGQQDVMSNFTDEDLQKMRISLKVADIGSDKMDVLLEDVIKPRMTQIFENTDFEITITGTTPIFIKGNRYLVENLRLSLLVAFTVIAFVMGLLFSNLRMIIISLVPNMIPLIITAGVMGYFGVPLKPSTALIFSIAFGISVDDTIHFLAKYRQELFANNFFVPIAVTKTLKETGKSMIYTSIVLFAGFIVFVASDFGGTVALGFLTSATLLVAMLTNLIVLPSLLLTFDDGKRRKDVHPIIEQYDDNFYVASDDEEIDLKKISKANRTSSDGDSEEKNT
ncbi:MMPL family transporter [Marivirga sp. S37H4]|uniref:MMPL family transporter n=1 Tax=Marivirga aurantiaca TaxID=2802615 RepID=A0A934X1F3_9BACT|nr:MMPL family transporter [Marivirga aurantiaca]MBK6266692.1 MMPL family transporter [Marivirga aurantiaca]